MDLLMQHCDKVCYLVCYDSVTHGEKFLDLLPLFIVGFFAVAQPRDYPREEVG